MVWVPSLYRARHSPGVGAAAWEAVLLGGLKPVFLTERKLYGTWGEADPLRSDLLTWLEGTDDFDADVQDVAGHELVRVVRRADV